MLSLRNAKRQLSGMAHNSNDQCHNLSNRVRINWTLP
jgi:hypothetical protein